MVQDCYSYSQKRIDQFVFRYFFSSQTDALSQNRRSGLDLNHPAVAPLV